MEHYDRGFRMDTAFLNQVGITQGWTYVAPSFYPDAKRWPWFKRVVPFAFAQYGRDRVQDGRPWIVVPGVRLNFTRQGFFRLDEVYGDEVWAGHTFRKGVARVFAEAQVMRWLYLSGRAFFGRAIFYDPLAPYLGRSRTYSGQVTLQPSARLSETLTYDRVQFDRLAGGRVYAVDVVNTRTTFLINRYFALRGIVQFDSSRHQVLTDFLASWELLPGTVAYAGYGSLVERQDWDGTELVPGRGAYRTSQRGLFFKASYVHRF